MPIDDELRELVLELVKETVTQELDEREQLAAERKSDDELTPFERLQAGHTPKAA